MTTPAARLAKAGLLLEQHRHEEALDMLDAYSTEHATIADSLLWQEVKRMLDYAELMRVAQLDERDAYQLDSLEVADLLQLAGGRQDRAAVWIGNLLCAAYGHCTPPLTGGDGLAKARRRVAIGTPPEGEPGETLILAPNPASHSVYITYSLNLSPSQDAWLHVTDAFGRVVHRARLSEPSGTLMQGLSTWTAGLYTVSIKVAGTALLNQRLVIAP